MKKVFTAVCITVVVVVVVVPGVVQPVYFLALIQRLLLQEYSNYYRQLQVYCNGMYANNIFRFYNYIAYGFINSPKGRFGNCCF